MKTKLHVIPGASMLTERPAVFEGDLSFMFLHRQYVEEVSEFLSRKHIDFEMIPGPGHTVKFNFLSLTVYDVERLLIELTRSR